MLLNHVADLLSTDLPTQLLHRQKDVLLSDLARAVCVKLTEDCLEAVVSQKVADINGRSQELTVVDLLVVVIVHLIDHFSYFSITHIHSLLHQNIVKLLSSDHTCAISIDGLEGSSQLLDLLLRCSLDKQVHRGLLESCNAFEASQALKHIIADLYVRSARWLVTCHGLEFEPRVLQGVLSTQSLLLVDNQELVDQVLALRRHVVELYVVKVELSLFDLAEDLSSVGALEWQVPADEGVQ